MASRRLGSPLAVVVLGMLAEESLHPYGMRQRASERAYDRLPGVRVSSLYDTVGRLANAGLIRADDPTRDGGRPERTRYTITPEGLEMQSSWVEAALADHTDADGFPAALSFMYPLGRERVLVLLNERIRRLAASLDADEDELAQSAQSGTPPIFLSEHRYLLARRRAEHDWVVGFVSALDSGHLGWPK